MTLPERTARLFAHEDLNALTRPEGQGLLIGRLLEEGDGEDLRWLFSQVPAAEAKAWFAVHAGRKLSRRSRAFWSAVLDSAPGPINDGAAALWPL